MDYKDIQYKVFITTNKLNSILFILPHFTFTDLTDTQEIIRQINETISDLTQIKSEITEI